MTRYMLAAALFAVLGGSALAQTSTTTTTTTTGSDQFYVVQDTSTKKCTVVTQKPSGTNVTIVGGDGTVYKTRSEAETVTKSAVCTN